MRIVIVTVYNSMNSGSFLQANSLYTTLKEKYGNEVYFLKTNARNPFKDTMAYCTRKFLKGNLKSVQTRRKMYREFKNCIKDLPEISYDQLNMKEDIFVLGSDEIWNIKRSCMNQFPIFWGKGLPYDRVISYAPSLNTSTKDDIERYDYALEAIDKINALSVRDSFSKKEIQKISNREIHLVGDPTNLVEVNDFINKLEPYSGDDYVLVYIDPTKINEQLKENILQFAKQKNLKLISFSFQNTWCDSIVNGSPYTFLSYIYNAKYVFTATFHGTTFSLLFNKQFVAFNRSNEKVYELLSNFDLTERMDTTNTLDNIALIADSEYDKDLLNQKFKAVREDSIDFIESSITKIQKGEE